MPEVEWPEEEQESVRDSMRSEEPEDAIAGTPAAKEASEDRSSDASLRKLRRQAPVLVRDVFVPNGQTPGCDNPSRVFRIPALLTLPGGVVLAFCEKRQDWHDSGLIDLVLRRSDDNGESWEPLRTVCNGKMLQLPYQATVGNPTAVWDGETKTVWLLLCSNHGDDSEFAIHARQSIDTRRVWVTSSSDLGLSWVRPREITSAVKLDGWTWYATGPGLGIQLRNGRLLVPCNHAQDVHEPHHPYLHHLRRSRMVAHVVYSDDHGLTWQLGGIAARHSNENTVAELPDGRVMLNARDWSGAFQRVVQLSNDGGLHWQAARRDGSLPEPRPWGCQGSLLRPQAGGLSSSSHAAAGGGKGGTGGKGEGGEGGEGEEAEGAEAWRAAPLFFCNPASCERREMLTVRRSDDGGRSWSASFVLEEDASAYSSMGLLSNRRLGVLYERGDRISFATLSSGSDGPLGPF